MDHNGADGPLFRSEEREGRHLVSLWSHEEIASVHRARSMVPVRTAGWYSVSITAPGERALLTASHFCRQLIKAELKGTTLRLKTQSRGTVSLWKGNPGYENSPVDINRLWIRLFSQMTCSA